MNSINDKYKMLSKDENLVILDKENALNLIADCELQNLDILGVDGFYIHGSQIQPDLSLTLDLSGSIFKENRFDKYTIAKKHILKQSDNVYFEVVWDEPQNFPEISASL